MTPTSQPAVWLGRAGGRPLHAVVAEDDGRVSAIIVRGVPALACEVCEESYYEPEVTDAIVAIVERAQVAPGEAVAIDFHEVDAA